MSEEAAPRAHVRTPETDEVLRRIGRNVVIFQQVEHLLKFLNAHSAVIGPASQLSARVEKQVAAVHKNTLGELAGKLASPMWGWLLAWPEDASPLRVTLQAIAAKSATTGGPIGAEAAVNAQGASPGFAAHIVDVPDLTVVTNALNIASELAVRSNLKLVVPGGVARAASYELVGPIADGEPLAPA